MKHEAIKKYLSQGAGFNNQNFNNAILELFAIGILRAKLEAKKEVFDDFEIFNDSLSKRLYSSLRYKEFKKRHLASLNNHKG